ncbi:FUSC family protein [Sphingomonas sp.]|uniref:FUSC family protein n=1 Tax=Sphingomonas sp. TaxID=28214 RepID=UPI0028993866|nr:FUSC family protein [Sphingomonas sp.]
MARWPLADMIRSVAFVARCTGAAVAALVIAQAMQLNHPVWASVSALVVSQDRLGDTNRSLAWRVAGTMIGIGVAIIVALAMPNGGAVAMLAVAVGITSAIARLRSELRLCMWTAVIVLLTVPSGGSVLSAALDRAQEVLLGVAIGAVLHWAADRLVFRR